MPPAGVEFYLVFGSTNMPRLTALGCPVRVFRVVCGQWGTAKDGEEANGSPETAGIVSTTSLARRKFVAMKTAGLITAWQPFAALQQGGSR
jgi:hypothetical protein